LTGFDRIYFCHFDAVGHGHVLGESNNGVLSSLRDHHFPATDIPFAARQIMLVNPFRLIPDVDAPDVAILGGDGLPLDLTFSACRAIADSHLRYLRNMGATASLSFSVVADGGLEALFGGHHHTARRVPIHRMAACRHLVELFRARYEALRMREDRAFMARYTRAAHELAADFIQTDCDPVSFVAEADHAFRDLMDADDVLCRFDRQDHFGRLLPPSQACAVLDFVSQRIAGGIGLFRSDSLMTECTDFGLLCPAVAGALAVSLGLSGNNIVVWLRSEAKVNQTWAGDPHQPVQMDGTGGMEPRGSFLAYVRQTARSCRPWSPASAELARQFRYIFSQALARHYETRMRKGAEQATALKTEFIANVSHELRSPMHSIIGFSEMLAEDGDILSKEKRQRFLRTIIDSSRRLLHLIDDLLDLSSLHAGKMIFHPRVGDILPTIERAVAEVDGLARPKQIEITILRDGNRRPVSFDPVRIEQVIINLLSNALKFSPPRSAITIDVSTSHAGRDLPGLIIEVSDQGVGIPTIELDLIFEKFMQSSRTRSGAGGTGLGLAICREIIEAHGGRIWAVNNPSGGTSLFVALPHAPPEGIPA
jgi:light-regulated signal transduction histidine kinase (bacteriophytochrome)